MQHWGVARGGWRLGWLWPVLWTASIFATSSTYINSKQLVKGATAIGGGTVSEQSFQSFWSSWWWLFVKGWHFTEFAILFLLLQAPMRRAAGSLGRGIVYAALLCVSYACFDEWHQTFVKSRGGLLSDVLIDSAGVAFAAMLVVAWEYRRRHRLPAI